MNFDIWSFEKKPLPEILSFIVDNRGKTVPTTENGHILIATNCIKNENLYPSYEKIRYLSEETYQNWFRAHPKPGDILFVCKGTPGRVCMVPDPIDFCIAQDMVALRANEAIVYNKYLLAVLRSARIQKQIEQTSVGDVIPHFKKSFFNQLLIPIPPMQIQRIIGDYYFVFSEKVEINNKINDNLYHLLSLSFKNDYWDKAIDHPEWIMTTLDETTSRFGTGLNPRKNFVLGHGNNYYVTIKNMGNNRIYLDERCDKIDDEAIRRIQMRSDLKVGDLLFSGIGTIGRVFLIDKPATNWNTSESVFNLRPNAKVSSEFLYLLLLNNDMQDYAINLASGSVQKGIRMADLKKYSFFLPTLDVIKRLTSLWKPLIKQIKANEVESDSLAVLRDTLLPKLMSGEIDVSAVQL